MWHSRPLPQLFAKKQALLFRASTVTCFYFRNVFISIFLRIISGKKLLRPSREIQIPSGAARLTIDRYLYLPLPFLDIGYASRFYGWGSSRYTHIIFGAGSRKSVSLCLPRYVSDFYVLSWIVYDFYIKKVCRHRFTGLDWKMIIPATSVSKNEWIALNSILNTSVAMWWPSHIGANQLAFQAIIRPSIQETPSGHMRESNELLESYARLRWSRFPYTQTNSPVTNVRDRKNQEWKLRLLFTKDLVDLCVIYRQLAKRHTGLE